jgi:ATP-binding cassette subfamily F protein 3
VVESATIIKNGVVESNNGEAIKLNKIVSMSSTLSEQTSAEIDQNRYLWGQDNKVAAMTNAQRDAHESTVSAKDKRKARKELEAARKEYEAKMALIAQEEEGDAGKASVSHMVLPDYRSGRNEKDIHVRNISLSLDNGTALLDDGELKLAHKRRYGLVGKNGVGEFHLNHFNRFQSSPLIICTFNVSSICINQ